MTQPTNQGLPNGQRTRVITVGVYPVVVPVSNNQYFAHTSPKLRERLGIPEWTTWRMEDRERKIRPSFDSLTPAQQEGVYQEILAQQQASNEADRTLRFGANMGYPTDWLIRSAGLMDYHQAKQEAPSERSPARQDLSNLLS